MPDIVLDQQESLQVGRRIAAYTGVIVHAGKDAKGKDRKYSAGSTSGYVLEFDNPYGTQDMAYRVLASLRARNVPYQPFTSGRTIYDPAAEIGDSATVNEASAVIWSVKTPHSDLMLADVSAPYNEELDHEFKYEPRSVRQFKRESAYTRSRLALNEDSIQLEVLRRTEMGKELGSRIDMRLNSITLSVSSLNGSSTFTLKDGTTTLDTKTLDLTVEAVNVHGTLTASQIAAGAISIGKLDADAKSKLVVSSQSRTQYYLSTSSSTATGGSWSNTYPSNPSGKYIWTRERTTVTYADGTTDDKYSPSENGRYDKGTNEALERSRIIYRSTSGGTAPAAPTEWVTDNTGEQNKWTMVRPEYSKDYPALYVATQRETVTGTFSVTTPKLDATTTVIDGAHIITGTIDADKISVTDLSAFGATIGGWRIQTSRLDKETDLARVRILAPSAPSSSDNAISVATRETTEDSFSTKFSVTYGGKVTCSDIKITGGEMTGGTVGGASVGAHSFGGASIPSSGAYAGKLRLTSDNMPNGIINTAEKIAANILTTAQMVAAIGTSLGNADNYAAATVSGTSSFPTYFKAGYITANNWIYTPGIGINGYGAFWKYGKFVDNGGTETNQWILCGNPS